MVMTRKKWNRLRRQRPELFKDFAIIGSGWETVKDLPEIRYWSRQQAVEQLTSRIAYHLIEKSC